MKYLALVGASALLVSTPFAAFSHGAPNWKAVAWEKDQDTPEGLRWAKIVDLNSLSRAGDLVSFRESSNYIDDQDRPVDAGTRRPLNLNALEGFMRIHNCKTNEHLIGSTYRDASGKLQVQPLGRWVSVPPATFRVVHRFVCRQ